ncbi:MAG: type II toxin-antitoxin system RelE/ParE family toxin [Thiotrichales bacterium]|jgi:phage-related protein|nr:type II toxin-antitoxin system RelE/ParE family toxin [Thiotrichales bacterium]MBT7314681.1 type II toxin-antitoxin system RelE/ParE family toxin [Thiotrichales bacterium]
MNSQVILSVSFYRTGLGAEPVRDWLKDMVGSDKKIIGEDIKLVQYRWPLGMPLVRKMEPALWEVRSKIGGNRISRVFFTVSGAEMILLHGFVKKTQKTPKKDVDLSRSRKDKWFILGEYDE